MADFTIEQLLITGTQRLVLHHIDSARLDAELLLACATKLDRTALLAHGDQVVDAATAAIFFDLIAQRARHIPVAYLTSRKAFYGRDFTVTPATLIPRPESEVMIDTLKRLYQPDQHHALLDVGTGSGCLAITAQLELPDLKVTASDISQEALPVAELNAGRYHVDNKITFVNSNLFNNITGRFDFILANLPYLDYDRRADYSPELAHEPNLALYTYDHGNCLMLELVAVARNYLTPHGYLIMEMETHQLDQVADQAIKSGLEVVSKAPFTLVLRRAA